MECNHGRNCDEAICITKVPIFKGLNQDEIMEIANIIDHIEFKKGEIIFLDGDRIDKLYVINEGRVKITKISEDGKEQIVRILESGDFMGELSLFSQAILNNNVEALEATTVCIIEGEKLKDIIYKNPGISIKIIEELGKRLEESDNLVKRLGLHDVGSRVAHTLLTMAEADGNVNLVISKKDLASYIGMSRETLSRKLSEFQTMGLIKLTGQRQIKILNKEGLKDIGGW